MQDEVNIFDDSSTKLTNTQQPIIIRWQDQATRLWQISIKKEQSKHPTQNTMPNHMHMYNDGEKVQQVYKLPSTKQVIRYYHSVAFTTKATRIKAIKAGFYATWPMLTTSSVMKYYPKSHETQKGHMHQTKQGVQLTKQQYDKNEPQVIHEPQPRVQEVQVKVEDIKHIMYTNQTG